MDLNQRLRKLNDYPGLVPRENKISETIESCKEVCFLREQDQLLTYWEFLWTQLQYTRKRWWALQAALLCLACQILPAIGSSHYQLRTIGVIGCLFVVLTIPELWRSKESDSIQVEAACLYSLRQIYAARITLFGIVDIALLTLFSLALGCMGFTLVDVFSQFLLPVTVTACICFSLLCGKHRWSEAASLTACLIWGWVWWLLLMNEQIYTLIAPSVWAVLFALALIFLVLAVRRTVCKANQYWEVAFV